MEHALAIIQAALKEDVVGLEKLLDEAVGTRIEAIVQEAVWGPEDLEDDFEDGDELEEGDNVIPAKTVEKNKESCKNDKRGYAKQGKTPIDARVPGEGN